MNKYQVMFKTRKRAMIEADSFKKEDDFFEFEVDGADEPVFTASRSEVLFIQILPDGPKIEGAELEDSSEVS